MKDWSLFVLFNDHLRGGLARVEVRIQYHTCSTKSRSCVCVKSSFFSFFFFFLHTLPYRTPYAWSPPLSLSRYCWAGRPAGWLQARLKAPLTVSFIELKGPLPVQGTLILPLRHFISRTQRPTHYPQLHALFPHIVKSLQSSSSKRTTQAGFPLLSEPHPHILADETASCLCLDRSARLMGPGKFALELAISSKEAGRLLLALPCLASPLPRSSLPGGSSLLPSWMARSSYCEGTATLYAVLLCLSHPPHRPILCRSVYTYCLLLVAATPTAAAAAAAAHCAAVPSSLIARNSIDVARSQCVEFSLTRICFDACNFLALIRARRGTQLHAGPLLTRRRGISRVSGWSLAALPCLHLGWPLLVYIHTHTRVCVCRQSCACRELCSVCLPGIPWSHLLLFLCASAEVLTHSPRPASPFDR